MLLADRCWHVREPTPLTPHARQMDDSYPYLLGYQPLVCPAPGHGCTRRQDGPSSGPRVCARRCPSSSYRWGPGTRGRDPVAPAGPKHTQTGLVVGEQCQDWGLPGDDKGPQSIQTKHCPTRSRRWCWSCLLQLPPPWINKKMVSLVLGAFF